MMNLPFCVRIFLLAAICGGMVACEEAKTNTELLTEEVWKFNAFTNPDLDQDTRDFYQAILGITTYQYNPNGTYNVVYLDSTFEDYDGSWAFAVDETILVLDQGTADEVELKIISLDEDSFVYQYQDSSGTNEVTWIH